MFMPIGGPPGIINIPGCMPMGIPPGIMLGCMLIMLPLYMIITVCK